MSSWSSYPPRRSRSRSPPRSSYSSRAPHPDYGDYNRMDWDHDRDRGYGYDRGREPYDYRRGRSRSPPPDDSRKRRRSLSPYERDRYEPRPRHNDDYDTHSRSYGGGYSSPRRGHVPPPYPPRRAPPDPHTFDYPASLKQYAEWFRYFHNQQAIEEDAADKAAEQEAADGSKPRNGIKTRWEKYKKEFAANQLSLMFEHHKKSPWFAEKYDPSPEYQALRTRVRKEGWKGRLQGFLLDLESGKFDPDLNDTPPQEPTAPSSPAKQDQQSQHLNGESTTDGVNGSTSAAASSGDNDAKPNGAGDDDMQFNMDPEEEPQDDGPRTEANGKGSSSNTRRPGQQQQADRGEEIAAPVEGNQVMIRTIPPDIGRVKLEELCAKLPGFIYLALGDPLQKRNFYRAGWIRLRDDADMPVVLGELGEKKIEGFKLHVAHMIKPFVNRVRYAPEVASRPERLEKDLGNAKKLAARLEEEAAKLRVAKVSPPGTTPLATGDGVKKEGEQDAQGDLSMADVNGDAKEEEEEEPKENGSDAVERRVEKVMADLKEQGLVDVNDAKAYEERKIVVALDLYLEYLRAAFNTCYYCSVTTDHVEELQRKCIKHVRKPLLKTAAPAEEQQKQSEAASKSEEQSTSATEEGKAKEDEGAEKVAESQKEKKETKTFIGKDRHGDERWLEWLDTKLALLINRDEVDPRDYGGKLYEEELSKAVEQHIKQEDEGKFRCKTCLKLFKATSFVEKHIANKHPELVKQLQELPYFNNFALDPHRINPFAHPPANSGNVSSQPPPQAFGIQGPPSYQTGGDPRGGQFFPPFAGGQYPPPPYHNGQGQWGEYPPYGMMPPMYLAQSMPMPPRDDRGGRGGGRLGDRIGGYADGPLPPASSGLPAKPAPAALDQALSAGGSGRVRTGGGERRNGGGASGPPPPPPPDAKEDPRAVAGRRVSYHDMDLVAEGDVELSY
ncbi:hypothetical protein DFP72DRAFT_956970 [Ephemerocybe angulata]|uniref:C2H2-type domain-containing protein n=1 Tax=Ephemerocybe angulata TaxID=980116 RepID=A0A8H6IBH8_9AGAR|nr:hypothetical protein DFP72DRAFT_956970 [Tulosesus angulatus]